MNKKISTRSLILLCIGLVGLISLNLTIIESPADQKVANFTEIIDGGTPVDCWIQVLRPGGTMTVRACNIEIGGICYYCKNVTDAYFVDYASTCTPE